MNIQAIPIADINPASYNPRKDLTPSDPAYRKIQKSIQKFGLLIPLVWNKRTGNLISGHQRLKYLKTKGEDTVECNVVDLDEQNEKAANLALNNITGENDIPRLKEILVSLDDGSFDLEAAGFTELELKELIDYEGRAGLIDDDEAPKPPAAGEVKTKKGDLYFLGKHRLLCGDALSPDDCDRLLSGAKADLVFTDPPYNVDFTGYNDSDHTPKEAIKNDKMTVGDFKTFLHDTFYSYSTSIKTGASLYVCHPSSYQREFQNAMEECGLQVRCQIIWAKNTFAWGFGRYKFQHEPIFYSYVSGESDPWYGDKSQSTLWMERKPSANRLHPTMKPVELVVRAIQNSSKAGDIVLDLFGGSGTTMIAAEKLGRNAYLMELDPAYCDVIVERWEKFTGGKAVLNQESPVFNSTLTEQAHAEAPICAR